MTHEKQFLIRHGNHWLFTDDTCTQLDWIQDRAMASRHTREWVDRFAADCRKQNKRVEIFTVAESQAMADRRRDQLLRARYFYALATEIKRLTPRRNYYVKGLGCPSYTFAVDPNFDANIPVAEAARVFVEEHRRRKKVPA